MHTSRTKYQLTFHSRRSRWPVAIRLRHLLKRMLRRLDFVCEEIREVKEPKRKREVFMGVRV